MGTPCFSHEGEGSDIAMNACEAARFVFLLSKEVLHKVSEYLITYLIVKFALQRGEGEKGEGVQISKQSARNL